MSRLLEIDRSFVREMEHSGHARTLVQGIVLLCRELGVTAVVEGVENEAQLAIAAELRCPLVQGFLLARPETAEQIDERLRAAAATRADHRVGALSRNHRAPVRQDAPGA